MKNKNTKVSIIGAGFVGSTTAYALMLEGLVEEIVIVDINSAKSLGEAMDISHGAAFVKPVSVKSGSYEDTKSSDLVIITAGLAQQPDESRLDLINKNIAVFRKIVPEIVKYSPEAILLVVSNPVDILSYITYKLSGFPKERVIGSGTVLDSSRFRAGLAEYFDIDARNIHGYIVGEHGDSEIAAWSLTNIAGVDVDTYCRITKGEECEMSFKEYIPLTVKRAAYEMINTKGYTNYAVALAIRRICEAVIRDERSVLPVSALLTGEYGMDEIYIGIPSIVGAEGNVRVVEVPFTESELEAFQESAKTLREIIQESDLSS
jgi:L-lactate dehydrogenase